MPGTGWGATKSGAGFEGPWGHQAGPAGYPSSGQGAVLRSRPSSSLCSSDTRTELDSSQADKVTACS